MHKVIIVCITNAKLMFSYSYDCKKTLVKKLKKLYVSHLSFSTKKKELDNFL